MLCTQAQHPSNSPYNLPSQFSPGNTSTSEDESAPALGGELFGHSSSSAVFATAGTLASCTQYLEPILRGVLTTYAYLSQQQLLAARRDCRGEVWEGGCSDVY